MPRKNTDGKRYHRFAPMTAIMAYNCISRWSGALGVCAIIAVIRPAHADPRAVVELFTSQGCSSCPPADQIVGELAKDPNVIALSMPIDYWDYLGWKDTLADSRFSARQKAYSHVRGDRNLYTPQMIVNGSAQVIGSDRAAIEGAIKNTSKAEGVMSVPVTMTLSGKLINVSVEASKVPTTGRGEVWICSVSKAVPISIGRGENRGQQITYYNVVRNLVKVGDWNGGAGSWTIPLENISRDGVDAAVVYVQDGSRDKPGAMLGAAYTRAALVSTGALALVARMERSAIRDQLCSARVIPGSSLRSIRATSAFNCSARVAGRRTGRADGICESRPTNEKGPTFVGPVSGLTPSANRPDPDGPGGLGAEESGTERTGPTQDYLVAT